MFVYDEQDDLNTSAKLKASHVNGVSTAFENFINEGISRTELKRPQAISNPGLNPYVNQGSISKDLVYRPEFYGAPSPRMIAVSGQTHFRQDPFSWSDGAVFQADISGSSYVGVPGACTRVKLRHRATVNILCSFYMFELGGLCLAHKEGTTDEGVNNINGYESTVAGRCSLRINGEHQTGSYREIFTSNVRPHRAAYRDILATGVMSIDRFPQNYQDVNRGFIQFPMIGRHQHHFAIQRRLDKGVHDIGLTFKAQQPPYKPKHIKEYNAELFGVDATREVLGFSETQLPTIPAQKNIFFLARNLVVDCYYYDNLPV